MIVIYMEICEGYVGRNFKLGKSRCIAKIEKKIAHNGN